MSVHRRSDANCHSNEWHGAKTNKCFLLFSDFFFTFENFFPFCRDRITMSVCENALGWGGVGWGQKREREKDRHRKDRQINTQIQTNKCYTDGHWLTDEQTDNENVCIVRACVCMRACV